MVDRERKEEGEGGLMQLAIHRDKIVCAARSEAFYFRAITKKNGSTVKHDVLWPYAERLSSKRADAAWRKALRIWFTPSTEPEA